MDVTIRDMETLDELWECVRMQEEIWGEGFSERVPISLLKVARRLGGVVAGAFDASEGLVGFVFGLTGAGDGGTLHWSDMLAVRLGWRDRGLGRRLKSFQRARCLERGIARMRWTFDPLEARNAYLNFGHLGAVAPEYVPDMYGDSDSPVHRGLGTDRFVALWELDSARTEARLEGRDHLPALVDVAHLPHALRVDERGTLPAPGAATGVTTEEAFLVPVPGDIQDMKLRDPRLAAAWRVATRDVLAEALDGGAEVRELIRGATLVSYYLVVRPAP